MVASSVQKVIVICIQTSPGLYLHQHLGLTILWLKRLPRMPHKKVLPNRRSTIVSGTNGQLVTKSYFQTTYPEFETL
jgi:hypothetical protein